MTIFIDRTIYLKDYVDFENVQDFEKLEESAEYVVDQIRDTDLKYARVTGGHYTTEKDVIDALLENDLAYLQYHTAEIYKE